MTTRLNGTSLFLQAVQGLTSNYANLMAGSTGNGLTLDSLKNISDDVNKSSLNQSFVSYLTSNFGSFDKDNDGTITQEELQAYTNSLSQGGMTREQLTQLCSQGGTDSLLETVLTNFDQIDKDHDGKVTNEEIALWSLNKEIDEMKGKYKRVDENSTASIYYSSSVDDAEEA